MKLLPLLLLFFLTACGEQTAAVLTPVEVTRDTSCSLDGMLLAEYPGPKAQMHYINGAPEFFCDTTEMFSLYLRPEQQKRVAAVFVQDMGKAEWTSPKGEWINAKTAWYVHGSKRHGAMGPTLASFGTQEQATTFAKKYGGKILKFEQVTVDMVALDGHALHDNRM